MSPYRSRLIVAMGLAPWLVAFPIYRVAVQIHKQIALPRFLGLLEFAAVGLAIAAVAIAAVPVGPRAARWGRPLLFAAVLANVAATGLAVYFNELGRAPAVWMALIAVAAVALSAAFATKPAEEQALTLRAVAIAGLAGLVGLGAAFPYVLAGALGDHPRNELSPTPAAQVAVRPGAPKRIVLVTFDELRWRSTSLADPRRDTTPSLAALAERSTDYTDCHSAGDQTIVSMPTVLSGIRPPDVFSHVYNNMGLIRAGAISGVAGFLKAAGYHTTYSTLLIEPRTFGMRDEYDDGWGVGVFADSPFNGHAFLPLSEVGRELVPQRLRPHRRSAYPFDVHPIYSVVEQAVAMYREPAERSFLWVHMGLPHHPYYRIPKADVGKTIKPPQYKRVHPFLNGHLDDPGFYESAYDDYTRFTDARFGQLIAGLAASPEWQDTLLIVTADHGTRLRPQQPGPYGVGEAPEDITHVPLLIHAPGQTTGARVGGTVRHEDVVPTILSQVYPAPPAGFKGAPLLGAPPAADRIGYTWAVPPSDARRPQSPARRTRVAYQGRYKLLVDHPGDTARLVDWQRDPDGRQDLSAAHPEVAAKLKAWLDRELPPS